MNINKSILFLSAISLSVSFVACNNLPQNEDGMMPRVGHPSGVSKPELVIQPKQIKGVPRAENNDPTDSYGPTNVQAQLNIDVKEGIREVKVIRDNSDPMVITKPYSLMHADPYAIRGYLEAAVGAKSINTSPAQVTSIKFNNGKGVVLVSAEEYRFADSAEGRGIDSIVKQLDRPGLVLPPDADAHIYFPKISRAANLRDMLIKVGSSSLDPEFEISPSSIMVDAELNALIIKAPKWNREEMLAMLQQYDRPIPEIKISYRILEIYAENDDRIGVDFQSWKNNDGVDLFSAGSVNRRNWGTFFASGIQNNGSNRTSYWNFNPKWNTRYLDFMTSIGKAKVLARGELVAQNRVPSNIQVNTGFFYDRTYYSPTGTTLAEVTSEFAYTEPNPDTILRESFSKILPYDSMTDLFAEAGSRAIFAPTGYTRRMIGTQTTTNTYGDVSAVVTKNNNSTDPLAKYLVGYVKADGTPVTATWYNTDWNTSSAAPGVIHGWLQYPMISNGFKFDLNVTPIITGKAAKIHFDLNSISLLGWNSDGSPRTSASETATTFQIGYETKEFVIGGLRKSETVRSMAGLPYVKDIPFLGRVFSTESESIKQSQLVLVAVVEYSNPGDTLGTTIRENLGKITEGVNDGMNSRVGNMFFQQYGLDADRDDREKRLNELDNRINDDYKEVR